MITTPTTVCAVILASWIALGYIVAYRLGCRHRNQPTVLIRTRRKSYTPHTRTAANPLKSREGIQCNVDGCQLTTRTASTH